VACDSTFCPDQLEVNVIRAFAVVVSLGLFVAAPASAQSSQAPPSAEEKPLGKRLRVELTEVRQRGGTIISTTPCSVMLHADGGGSRVFAGTQVALTANERGATTTTFKNAGVEAEVSARALPDGRYRLSVKFERATALGGGDNVNNPVISVMKSESMVTLHEGDTVPLATAVDPGNGDILRTDLKLTAGPVSKATAAATGGEPRLRAGLAISRHQGDKTIARRPYSVVLQPDGEMANTFSGSMLPVQVTYEGQPTVMLKDVGAGLRLKAKPAGDGRYRLDLSFSDGTIEVSGGSPRVRAFQSETQLVAQVGEAIQVASAVDPQTGEVIEAELSVEAVK
jgi:hypothetical protein